MNRITAVLWCAGAAFLIYQFHCSPVSTEPSGEEPALLQLSLEETGRTTAEFSGAPIQATVLLDRDTSFNVLTWHTGQGYPLYPEAVLDRKARKFTIELYWTSYPLYKDSTDGFYHDTVWVSMGGGLKKSNKVRIKVTNLPIVVDSARFDTTMFLGQDTVWQCSLPTVLQPSYLFTIYARDLDRKPPQVQVLGNKGTVIPNGNNPLEMEYLPPTGDFKDTIDFVIFDQMRGQAFRTLLVKHIIPNLVPVIDSVQVKTSILKASSLVNGVYRVAFTAFDTLQIRVFAHDTLGAVRRAVWKADKNRITADSASSFRATYICSTKTCTDTLKDASVVVDMITVTVYDDRGDSAVRKIELSKGKLDQLPQLQSFHFNGTGVMFSDTTARVTAIGGYSYRIGMQCTDPEKKPLTVEWTGNPSSRFSEKTDSTIKYTAPTVRGTDTLRLVVSDGALSITRRLLISVDDIGPQFDSLLLADTVLKGTDTVFTLEAVPGDTILCIAYATDRDTGDSMTYDWTSGDEKRFIVRIENRARYNLPDPIIKDTIIMTLQDGAAQVVRRVVLRPANRRPVIDSIIGDGILLTGTAAYLSDTAIAGDTVSFTGFARDPDGGKLTWLWSGADTSLFISRVASSVKYLCIDSVYTDTVSLTVKDEDGANTVKKVILQVETLNTP